MSRSCRPDDGTLRADDNGRPASARGVRSYVMRAFGERLDEARAAMEALAASLPPEELNRVGFRLYERFRPDVPPGAGGWRKENCELSESSRREGNETSGLELLVQFGGRVRECRTAAAITQDYLAAVAGMRQPYLADIEHGAVNPTLTNIANIAAGSGWRRAL